MRSLIRIAYQNVCEIKRMKNSHSFETICPWFDGNVTFDDTADWSLCNMWCQRPSCGRRLYTCSGLPVSHLATWQRCRLVGAVDFAGYDADELCELVNVVGSAPRRKRLVGQVIHLVPHPVVEIEECHDIPQRALDRVRMSPSTYINEFNRVVDC